LEQLEDVDVVMVMMKDENEWRRVQRSATSSTQRYKSYHKIVDNKLCAIYYGQTATTNNDTTRHCRMAMMR
jgi:hypothetical protein